MRLDVVNSGNDENNNNIEGWGITKSYGKDISYHKRREGKRNCVNERRTFYICFPSQPGTFHMR